MDKIPLIVVCGPTAGGKTAFSVSLAKKINAEIVSFDSMQVYKELSVSTAKPNFEEQCGIKHHMIDCVSVYEDFSVACYCSEAKRIIDDIVSRGKNVILVGGTGLYIDSLVNNVDFSDKSRNEQMNKELTRLLNEKGPDYLYDILSKYDPESAEKIHPNNTKRVIRALEIFYATGTTKTNLDSEQLKGSSSYNALWFGVGYKDRNVLYKRINQRVDIMFANGLVDEAKKLYEMKNVKTSVQAIGCKEIFPYFKGEKSLEECKERLKMQTRHYAKRQLTWFRRNNDIDWLYFDESDFESNLNSATDKCLKFLQGAKSR